MSRAVVLLALLCAIPATATARKLGVSIEGGAPGWLQHEVKGMAAERAEWVARSPSLPLLRVRVRRHEVVFMIVEPGAPRLEQRLAHPTPARVRASLRMLFDGWSARQPPPATLAPEPAAAPSPEAEPSGEPPSLGLTRSAAHPTEALLDVSLDGGVLARRLHFDALSSHNLATYDGAAAALLGFHLALQPFGRTSSRWLRGFGAVADFAGTVAANAAHADGTSAVPSPLYAYDVGLRERVRIGAGRFAPAFGLVVQYGGLRQSFLDGDVIVAGLPSVSYEYARVGLDGVIALGPVAILVEGGYRAVGSSGYVGSRFSRTSVNGFDAGAAVVAHLPRGFALVAGAQYVRFAYSFHPQAGDAYVANGAFDELVVGRASLAWSH